MGQDKARRGETRGQMIDRMIDRIAAIMVQLDEKQQQEILALVREMEAQNGE